MTAVWTVLKEARKNKFSWTKSKNQRRKEFLELVDKVKEYEPKDGLYCAALDQLKAIAAKAPLGCKTCKDVGYVYDRKEITWNPCPNGCIQKRFLGRKK